MIPSTFLPRLTLALALLLLAFTAAASESQRYEGMPDGRGSYESVVELYGEFLEWKDPAKASRTNPLRDVAGQATDVYPDYGQKAIDMRRQKMREFRKRMEADGMALLDVDYKGYKAFIDEQAKVMLEAAREANIIQ